MTTIPMFKVTRKGKFVCSLRKSDLVNHGDLPVRLRYEIAAAEGGNIAASILRGHVTEYSDGSYSVRPRNAKGYATDARGNLISYWAIPYDFDSETGKEISAKKESA